MGDITEFTVGSKHQLKFYKITSSAVAFEVKAVGNATIGLARGGETRYEYLITLGDHNNSWIKRAEVKTRVETPNIINDQEFRKFWISWSNGFIRVGQSDNPKPFLTHPNDIKDLQKITFSCLFERNPVTWRVELPPIVKNLTIKPLTKGQPVWVPATNQLPDDAIIGGFEYEVLYVIRSEHNGSLTPGKFVPSEGLGYVSWGGGAHECNNFEVLCGFDCSWVKTRDDLIPVKAIPGGQAEETSEVLYVGRAMINGHLIPGKVQPSHKVCYIAYDNREVAVKDFEVLVHPSIVTHCDGTYYHCNSIDHHHHDVEIEPHIINNVHMIPMMRHRRRNF